MDAASSARKVVEAWGPVAPPVAVWSSPFRRTESVARLVARTFGASLHVDGRLSELSFGEWEGREWTEIERSSPERFQRWMAAYSTVAPPGGETMLDLRCRVAIWLAEVSASPGSALAVTHAGGIRVARAIRDGLSNEEAMATPVEHLVPEAF